MFLNMKKKVIGIIAAIVVVLGLGLVAYNQVIPDEYVPAADEIALHIQFDTEEDVGLLVYDYRIDSHEYSGGISNADKSFIKRDSEDVYKRQAVLDGIYHGVIEPVVLVHIGKDVLTFSNAHSKLHGDGGEFGAGDGTLRFKVAVAYAGHNA